MAGNDTKLLGSYYNTNAELQQIPTNLKTLFKKYIAVGNAAGKNVKMNHKFYV
jgi:hypothetical protein